MKSVFKKKELKLIKFVKTLFLLFELCSFPKRFSKFSRKDFDNWQLFALYILFRRSRMKYRQFFWEWLPCCKSLLQVLKLKKVPDFSTVNKFVKRLRANWAHKVLGKCIRIPELDDIVVGIDGTGRSMSKGSRHYYRRAGIKVKKKDFIKTVSVACLKSKIVTAIKIRKKARHDNVDFEPLMRRTRREVKIKRSLGDKAFDAEKNHELMEELGAEHIVPLKNKVPVWRTKGQHRKKLRKYFPKKKYNKRVIKESIIGAIKRKYEDVVSSVNFHMQKMEIIAKTICHNIDMILRYLDDT